MNIYIAYNNISAKYCKHGNYLERKMLKFSSFNSIQSFLWICLNSILVFICVKKKIENSDLMQCNFLNSFPCSNANSCVFEICVCLILITYFPCKSYILSHSSTVYKQYFSSNTVIHENRTRNMLSDWFLE